MENEMLETNEKLEQIEANALENTDEVKEFFAEYIKELVNLRADVNTMARYFNSEIKNIRNSIKDIQENDEYEDHWTEDNPDFVI